MALEDAIGLFRRDDAMDGEHRRVAHGLLHRVRGVDAEHVRRVVRAHHADAAEPDAHVQEIDEAQVFVARGDFGSVVGRQPGFVRQLVVAGEPDAHRDLSPTSSRTALTTSTPKRIRFSRLPP